MGPSSRVRATLWVAPALVDLLEKFFQGLAHRAGVGRFPFHGVTTDGADENVYCFLALQIRQGFLEELGVDLFHFVGKLKAAQGLSLSFCLGRGDHAWIHLPELGGL